MQAPTAKPMFKIRWNCAYVASCSGTTVSYKRVHTIRYWCPLLGKRVKRGEFGVWPREPDPNDGVKSPKLPPECE